MFLLSVYTSIKFSISYTHIYFHRDILSIQKLPKFSRNVVFYRLFLLSKFYEIAIDQFNIYRIISAHLQLLIQNFEGKLVQKKYVIFLPLSILHLSALISSELSSPQHIPDLHQDYAESSPHSAGISMQTQLRLKYICTKWICSKCHLK